MMPASTVTPTPLATELLTHARVDCHDLPLAAGRFAVITLDNGAGKPNTFGPGGLAALESALDEIAGESVAGVGIIGQARGFAAGADLRQIAAIESRQQGRAFGAARHHAFRRLGALPVPAFAFLTGQRSVAAWNCPEFAGGTRPDPNHSERRRRLHVPPGCVTGPLS